jgi:DNA-directed RNA polymerase subunit RPC12/RpoP
MKIGDNLYKCPWCGEEIKHIPNSSTAKFNPKTQSPGRHKVTSGLRCTKCGRIISQK